MAKVIIGLSGGVDSAVAAHLLKKQGHEVIAVFMRNWDSLANNDILGNPFNENQEICPQEQDYLDAKRVADQLGIELKRVDFVKEYWDYVFTYFIQEYEKGRTPNPDILCNKYIKFNAFVKYALTLGADFIATGHYARVEKKLGKNVMLRGIDNNKDQTYFLCQLDQAQIDKTLFPIGYLQKREVRQIAIELGLSVAKKKDSTGICFIGERDFKKFLQNYIPSCSGNIIDKEKNEVIGTHDGVMYYTLGQRKGLGIGGISGHESGSWFVVGKDVEKKILYVVQGDESQWLYSNKALISGVNWLGDEKPKSWYQCTCKFRYRQQDVAINLRFIDETNVEVYCLESVRAITPGQACVFYNEEICLGGGTIE